MMLWTELPHATSFKVINIFFMLKLSLLLWVTFGSSWTALLSSLNCFMLRASNFPYGTQTLDSWFNSCILHGENITQLTDLLVSWEVYHFSNKSTADDTVTGHLYYLDFKNDVKSHNWRFGCKKSLKCPYLGV